MPQKGQSKAETRVMAKLHRREALRLLRKGRSIAAIAEQLGISTRQVRRITDRAMRLVEAEFVAHRVTVRWAQVDQLEEIISDCLRGWERSGQPIAQAEETIDEDGKRIVRRISMERMADAGYYDLAMKAMDRLRSIFGLDVSPAADMPEIEAAELMRRLRERRRAEGQRA
jgi:hypothetical protein